MTVDDNETVTGSLDGLGRITSAYNSLNESLITTDGNVVITTPYAWHHQGRTSLVSIATPLLTSTGTALGSLTQLTKRRTICDPVGCPLNTGYGGCSDVGHLIFGHSLSLLNGNVPAPAPTSRHGALL
jgi:hypothetical protein